MSEPSDKRAGASTEAAADALRQVVERTLAATAEGASGTRRRAQDLLDETVRRGQVTRDRVARGGEQATSRLADAINELRSVDDESMSRLAARVDELERRLATLEQRSTPVSDPKVEVEGSTSAPHEQRESEA